MKSQKPLANATTCERNRKPTRRRWKQFLTEMEQVRCLNGTLLPHRALIPQNREKNTSHWIVKGDSGFICCRAHYFVGIALDNEPVQDRADDL